MPEKTSADVLTRVLKDDKTAEHLRSLSGIYAQSLGHPGSKAHPRLCEAPGTYVLVQEGRR